MSVVETFKKYEIDSIWHFTDLSNLKSIEKYGLLSLREIINNDIDACFGADLLSHNLDVHYGLDKFIHLAFIDDHPMYHIAKDRGSIMHPVWIELDISLLFDKNTLFSNKVANQSGAKIFTFDDINEMIDFDQMFHRDFWTRVEARKAEIMISDIIDTKYIKAIYDDVTGEKYGK